jgi:hypothetical protein
MSSSRTSADLNAAADAALFKRLGAERYTALKQNQQAHAAVAQLKAYLERARFARQTKRLSVAEFEEIRETIDGHLARIHGKPVVVAA